MTLSCTPLLRAARPVGGWARRGLLASLAVVCLGCGPTATGPVPVAVAPPTGARAAGGPGASPAPEASVPADAMVVGVLRAEAVLDRWLPVSLGMEPGSDEAKALRMDLDAYAQRHFGVDIGGLKDVVLYAASEGAVLARGVQGTPKQGTPAGEHEGTAIVRLGEDVFAAHAEGGLLVGSRGGVERMLDVAAGRAPALGTGALAKALDSIDGAELAVTADLTGPLGAVLAKAELPPVSCIGVALGSGKVAGLHVAVVGTPEQVAALHSTLDGLRTKAQAMVAAQRKQVAAEGDTAGELGLLVADYSLRGVFGSMALRADGELLTLDLPFRALLPVGGSVASAIVIPSIVKGRAQHAPAAPKPQEVP